MFDDLLKLLRSPHWVNSPIARRFGFLGSELTYEESEQEDTPSNWTKISTSGHRPPMRSGHSSLVVGDVMYVFGGYNDGNCHNDVYAFNLVHHHWQLIEKTSSVCPDGRASHAWCASTDKTKLYLFGGSGPHWGQTNMGKLLQFNIRDKSWTIVEAKGTQPPPGYGQTMCANDNMLYLFGGTSGHVYVNDLYIFDEATKIWRKEETGGKRPSPRYKHQATMIDNRMYVIGGGLYDPPTGPIDTYYLDVGTLEWHDVECSGNIPKSRIAHTISQLSSDPYRLVMFGGRDDSGSRQNEMSELNLQTGEWQIFSNNEGSYQPDPRDFHTSVVYDDRIFVFGGSNGVERNNDVFRYTMKHQPSTLLILAMHVLHEHIDCVGEDVEALPAELKYGVENINSDVECSYNPTWYAPDDCRQEHAMRDM